MAKWNREKEKKRLFFLFGAALICMVGFLVKAGQIMIRYKEEAKQFAEVFSYSSVENFSPTSVSWMIIIVLVVLIVSGKIISVLEGKAEMSIRNRADIMMLTWYYSCLDNHIPQKDILQNFPKKKRHLFLKYVQGKSLNRIRDE